MDGIRWSIIYFSFIYVGYFMTALLTKGYLILVALFSLVLGFYMMFAPDVNSILLTFYVEEDQKNLTTFIRTISGLFAAGGYILLRFVFSSSRVQLGTVLIYLVGFMLVGKFSGFLYEGISPRSLIIFFIGLITFLFLLIERRKRRNQISYDL